MSVSVYHYNYGNFHSMLEHSYASISLPVDWSSVVKDSAMVATASKNNQLLPSTKWSMPMDNWQILIYRWEYLN